MSTACAGYTSEEFEEELWSALEASGAPALARVKVGAMAFSALRC